MLLSRGVLYTAVTRAREILIAVGDDDAVHYMIDNHRQTRRYSGLWARLAGEVADQYVAENMPAAGRRFAYLVERLKRGVTRLLAYLQAEQAQSLFHPAAFEQEIGTGEGAVPPLTLRTPDGRTVQVQGKIDRVDVMEREGRTYLRVVDYKTGNKAFNLDEVYCGLNTQMLLYLFTLRSNAAQVYKNPVAAGVLYLAGDPVLKTGSRAEAAAAPVYKVDGLVLNDELVVRAWTGTPRACSYRSPLERTARPAPAPSWQAWKSWAILKSIWTRWWWRWPGACTRVK
jgi:ATP-dependent helicase/DNAse subunit B